MAGRILLNKAGKCDHGRKSDLRVAGVPPGQAVSLGLIVIDPNEPLRPPMGMAAPTRPSQMESNRDQRRSEERTKPNVKGRTRAAEIAKSARIKIEPRIPRNRERSRETASALGTCNG